MDTNCFFPCCERRGCMERGVGAGGLWLMATNPGWAPVPLCRVLCAQGSQQGSWGWDLRWDGDDQDFGSPKWPRHPPCASGELPWHPCEAHSCGPQRTKSQFGAGEPQLSRAVCSVHVQPSPLATGDERAGAVQRGWHQPWPREGILAPRVPAGGGRFHTTSNAAGTGIPRLPFGTGVWSLTGCWLCADVGPPYTSSWLFTAPC